MTKEEKIICKQFLDDADKTHSCNEYKLLMALLKQEPTTKNNLGVDCISRDSAIKALDYDIKCFEFKSGVSEYMDDIAKLLDTIYEIQVNNIKAMPSVTPQEPILDKIRAEIETKYGQCDICEYFEDYDYEENCISEYRPIGDIADILEIIDKYKGENEG